MGLWYSDRTPQENKENKMLPTEITAISAD